MLIALTGFMGSGKTTVGRLLADSLGCPFLDLDEMIVKDTGRGIPEIFASEGEAGFRRREQRAFERTLSRYGNATAVLALGGGTVTLPGAVEQLRERTLCLYLQAPLSELTARLGLPAAAPGALASGSVPAAPPAASAALASRPLALDGHLAERLAQREPLYAAAAHVTLPTAGLTPEQVVDEIIIDCL